MDDGTCHLQAPSNVCNRQKQREFCRSCREIEAALISLKDNVRQSHEYTGVRDIYLGKKSELDTRSAWCLSCLVFISQAAEYVGGLREDQRRPFTGDYEFSAHLIDQKHVLGVAFGSPSAIHSASERRNLMMTSELGALWLYSTEGNTNQNSRTQMQPNSPSGSTSRSYFIQIQRDL